MRKLILTLLASACATTAAAQTVANLPAATSVAGPDLVNITQLGTPNVSKKATVTQLRAAPTPIAGTGVTVLGGTLTTDTTMLTVPPTNGVWFSGGPNVSFCPQLSCAATTWGSPTNDHQRAVMLISGVTQDDGHSEEQMLAVHTTIDKGQAEQAWAASHTYASGANLQLQGVNAVFRQTASGSCISGTSQPSFAYNGGPYTDGTCTWTWINASAIDAKVGIYNETAVLAGGGASWAQANNIQLQSGFAPRFAANTEFDFTNNSGTDCVIGIYCVGQRVQMGGTNLSTSAMDIVPAWGNGTPSGGAGAFATNWGLRLSGHHLSQYSDLQIDSDAPYAIGINNTGYGMSGHSGAAIKDASVSPVSVDAGGQYSYAAFTTVNSTNTLYSFTSKPNQGMCYNGLRDCWTYSSANGKLDFTNLSNQIVSSLTDGGDFRSLTTTTIGSTSLPFTSIVGYAPQNAQRFGRLNTALDNNTQEVGLYQETYVTTGAGTNTGSNNNGKENIAGAMVVTSGGGSVWNFVNNTILQTGWSQTIAGQGATGIEADMSNQARDCQPAVTSCIEIGMNVVSAFSQYPGTIGYQLAGSDTTNQRSGSQVSGWHYGFAVNSPYAVSEISFLDGANSQVSYSDNGTHSVASIRSAGTAPYAFLASGTHTIGLSTVNDGTAFALTAGSGQKVCLNNTVNCLSYSASNYRFSDSAGTQIANLTNTGTFTATSGLSVNDAANGIVRIVSASNTAYLQSGTPGGGAGAIVLGGYLGAAATNVTLAGPSTIGAGYTPASGNTAMALLVNNGTTTATYQVTVGAPDSAGTGYRVLRVPN